MRTQKTVLNEELKDIKAANQAFSVEIDRNQGLYRALH